MFAANWTHEQSSLYQFLQMEHSHKNTDCYFFYYSTCKKGDNCPFRHEPSALGCETMCIYWQQGKCLDEHCNFRHMELKKNRKSIPCYWETQPGGCRKPHCSFMHKSARAISSDPINPVKNSDLTSKSLNQEWLNRQDDTKYDGNSTESDQGRGSSEAGSFIGSPAVDPLIVKFEEESDNESVPSPVKPQPRVPYCKTYEEIRLEEIQAESAAYYSYQAEDYQIDAGGDKIKIRRAKKICPYPQLGKEKNGEKGLDFEVLSLEEIRRRKRRKAVQEKEPKSMVDAASDSKGESTADLLKDAMKTLTELRRMTDVRGVKRSLEDCHEDTKRCKIKCNDTGTSGTSNVPPVKLRRSLTESSPMRLGSVDVEVREWRDVDEFGTTSHKMMAEEETSDRSSGNPILDRLNSSESTESSNLARRNEVEIRLCDSSTDEDQNLLEKNEEKQSAVKRNTEESKETIASCDSLLNVNEDDYLTLDMASDDILKDIDALLKEKNSV
ncbi:zinc finger CCCH domain-containing protein 11A-like isoform X2 [Hylaeus anthracinus]|uniref:zinc finger CCCH domain-containing protein 11A-like isoform X2 n=1 Tax=Hylaeus anthracinus TaxID=313031 RepID=UPI0023BA3D18|nr:zinc finger CCCH domain-containing protein 11A-like isoform X2 [Hylaeus anthracinus]